MLRPDVVEDLYRAGRLTSGQRRAAELIEWVRTAESAGLRARASSFEPSARGGSAPPPSARFTAARRLYRRWEVYLVGRPAAAAAPGRPEMPAIAGRFPAGLAFATDLIVGADGPLTLREAERKYRWRNGNGVVFLRYILAVLCVIRGDDDRDANSKIVAAIEAGYNLR